MPWRAEREDAGGGRGRGRMDEGMKGGRGEEAMMLGGAGESTEREGGGLSEKY